MPKSKPKWHVTVGPYGFSQTKVSLESNNGARAPIGVAGSPKELRKLVQEGNELAKEWNAAAE